MSVGTPADLRMRFGLSESVEVRRRFNVAPTDEVLVATDERPDGTLARWGLVPRWAEDPRIGSRMVNARSETAFAKPAFRDAGRCLVIADGFFEWERRPDGGRQPHWVTREDRAPFAFAGLWTTWHGPEGDPLRSCAILTAPAAGGVARIHDRIPVILAGEDAEAAWLDGSPVPSPFEALELTPVGPQVNDVRYDGPACVEPVEPPATLF